MNTTGKGGFASRPDAINRKGRPKRPPGAKQEQSTSSAGQLSSNAAALIEADRAAGHLPPAPPPVQTAGLRDISALLSRRGPGASRSSEGAASSTGPVDPDLEALKRADAEMLSKFSPAAPRWGIGRRWIGGKD